MWWNDFVINEKGEEMKLFEIRKSLNVVDDMVKWNEIECDKRWCGGLGWKKEKGMKWKCDEMRLFEIWKPHNAVDHVAKFDSD